jgi:hypothetical protein
VYRNQFHVFARGSDMHIWHAWYDPAQLRWFGWVDESREPAGSAPTATAYTGDGDRAELHVLYAAGDGTSQIHELAYNVGGSAAWAAPANTGLTASTAPSTTQFENQLELWFGGSDRRLSGWSRRPGASWTAVAPLALTTETTGSAPSVAVYKDQLQVFWIGGTTPGGSTLMQDFYTTAGGWTAMQIFGNGAPSAPGITQYFDQFQVWWRDSP